MSSIEIIQKQMQEEIGTFNELQKKLQKLLKDRELSDSQLNENKSVYDELKLLQDGSKVYKLIGPALVKQDLQEAVKNVNDRIKFIEDKMKNLDRSIEDVEKSIETQRQKLEKLNQNFKQNKP